MKKTLTIASIIFFWCSTGFGAFDKLADELKFKSSYVKHGKIFYKGNEYRIWTKRDNKSYDKSLRKVVAITRIKSGIKDRDYFIIYNKNRTSYIKLDKVGKPKGDGWYINIKQKGQWYIEEAFLLKRNQFGNQDARYGKWIRNSGSVLYGVVLPKKGNNSENWKAWSENGSNQSAEGLPINKIKSLVSEAKSYEKKLYEIKDLLQGIENEYYAMVKGNTTNQTVEKTEAGEFPSELEQEKEKIAQEKELLEKEKKKLAEEKERLKKEKQKLAEEKKNKQEGQKLYAFSSGSGFITSTGNNGLVVTNNHVIEGCDSVVISHLGKRTKGSIYATDPTNDLAFLRAKITSSKVYPVSSSDPKLLQDVIIAGYPLGKEVSAAIKISKGSVSSLAGFGDNYSNFQTDAALNQGNSGGPIIDNKGNVVGVAVANYGKKEGIESFNFGIKSSTLRAFANSNGVRFTFPNRRELSNDQLGELITKSTVFLECHMTLAKIKKIIKEIEKNRKAVYEEFLK